MPSNGREKRLFLLCISRSSKEKNNKNKNAMHETVSVTIFFYCYSIHGSSTLLDDYKLTSLEQHISY